MIVSVGGIAIDLLMQLSRLPADGDCVVATDAHHGVGGKAANQAVAAARLGGDVALIGAVGDDAAGELVLQRIAAEGVRIDGVQRLADRATSMFVQQRAHGKKQAAVFPGANLGVTRELIDGAAAVIRAARIVLVQLEIPIDTVLHIADIARSAGAQVLLDPSPVRGLPAVLRATIVRANAREAASLTGIEVHDVASARAAASQLLSRGVSLAAIEAGSQANLFMTRDEEIVLPLYDLESVDPMGAGDALSGALAVAIAEGQPLRNAAAFAVAASALTTRALGAQTAMPRRDEVMRLLGA